MAQEQRHRNNKNQGNSQRKNNPKNQGNRDFKGGESKRDDRKGSGQDFKRGDTGRDDRRGSSRDDRRGSGQDFKRGDTGRDDRRGSSPDDRRASGRDFRRDDSGPEDRRASGRDYKKENSKSRYKKKSQESSSDNADMRLNKYIAHAGICSRREADKLIEAGLVSVNGKTITQVGTKVMPDDEVKYNGERLGTERKVYVLLNKPKDYVTTVEDPHAKKTVMDLIRKAARERIYPVGRLDKNTTGVLLFTNDGELTKKLTHPSSNKKKIYHVFLDRSLTQNDLNKISEGMELEDGPVNVDAIAYSSMESKREVGLEIHSGRNRVVRRIFESLGYKVSKLDRVYFAGLTKKNLPRGRWRYLTDKEVKMLKMNAFE